MYKLMKLEHCSGTTRYIIALASDNLNDIKNEIKKRVLDGCNPRTLFVFKDVGFEVLCGVKFEEEKK